MRGLRTLAAGRGLIVLACLALLATVPDAYAGLGRPQRAATRATAYASDLPFSSVVTARKIVALTFDDGPDPGITPRVLAILARHHARATFFTTGEHALAEPALLTAEARAGELGNHSLDHPHLASLPIDAVAAQLRTTDAILSAAAGTRPVWFRPPYGDLSPAIDTVARAMGYPVVLWDVPVDRYARAAPATAASELAARVRPGAIVLAHDGCPPADSRAWCVAARSRSLTTLDRLLTLLDARGFRVVTVSELLRYA